MTAIGRGARSFLKAVRRVVPTPPAPARAALESAPRADVAQLVERRLPKPKVAGSKPVVRFRTFPRQAAFPLLTTGFSPNTADGRPRRPAPLRALEAKSWGNRGPFSTATSRKACISRPYRLSTLQDGYME